MTPEMYASWQAATHPAPASQVRGARMESRWPASQARSARSNACPNSAGRKAKLSRDVYTGISTSSAAPSTEAPRRRAIAQVRKMGTTETAAAASFIARTSVS